MPSSRVTEKPFTTLLGEILSVTAGVKTEYPSSALMHSTIKTAAIATIVRIVAIFGRWGRSYGNQALLIGNQLLK